MTQEERDKQEQAEAWHVSLSNTRKTLKQALSEMDSFKLKQNDVPLIIQLTENPKYNFFSIFPGRVSLLAHDCIHILLGRGLLPKDEAFVIGFTMGSTQKMTNFKIKLFLFITKYLYPEGYKFSDEEAHVFEMGVLAGMKNPKDLSLLDFRWFMSWRVDRIRKRLGINGKFLKICYLLEKKKFKDSKESQRLL